MDKSRVLVSNPVLWPRVRDFLWDFAPQVHESWLSGVPGLSGMDGISEVSGIPRVRRYILDSLGVKPCFHFFPKDDGSRLLLLDGATLESAVKWLGTLACADSLRRVTDGATVRAFKAALPGVYPEVFGYTAYFRDFAARDAKTVDEILATGLEMLFSAVSGVPEPLVSRMSFKLPKELCDLCALGDERESARSVFPSILKLFKLRFPEAYKLCC